MLSEDQRSDYPVTVRGHRRERSMPRLLHCSWRCRQINDMTAALEVRSLWHSNAWPLSCLSSKVPRINDPTAAPSTADERKRGSQRGQCSASFASTRGLRGSTIRLQPRFEPMNGGVEANLDRTGTIRETESQQRT